MKIKSRESNREMFETTHMKCGSAIYLLSEMDTWEEQWFDSNNYWKIGKLYIYMHI